MVDPGGSRSSGGSAEPASGLNAARQRARAVRGALIKIAFGTLFLVGALAHALAPQRHDEQSRLWMTALLLLSTFNVGVGLRALTRAQRLRPRLWRPATAAWALLSVGVLALLLRR